MEGMAIILHLLKMEDTLGISMSSSQQVCINSSLHGWGQDMDARASLTLDMQQRVILKLCSFFLLHVLCTELNASSIMPFYGMLTFETYGVLTIEPRASYMGCKHLSYNFSISSKKMLQCQTT